MTFSNQLIVPGAALPDHGRLSRRNLLRFGGAAGMSFLASACGGGGGSGSTASSASSSQVTLPTTGTETPQSVTPAPTPTPTPAAPVQTKTEFGVCCYDLFYQAMYSSSYTPATRLKRLSDRGIKLVRFSAGPFWATDWAAWKANPDKYLRALDLLFDAADSLGMKLIVSVLYNPFGLSDYLGEPYSAWGDPNSATRRAMDAHVPTIVQRYKDRSSLFLWEFANEMNSFADLPNGYEFYPTINAAGGTPATRTRADNITMVGIQSCYARFAELVRQYDARHSIESGSNIPRKHQIHGLSGSYAYDTRDQFQYAMEQTLAGNTEVLSLHCYTHSANDRFSAQGSSVAEVLTLARQVADRKGVKLYVGEFGVPRSGDDAADKVGFRYFIDSLKAAKVDYATMWNYDWDYQPEWSVRVDNDRSWMLDMLAAANL